MSDGMSDSRAVGEIGSKLERAALELRIAIRRAEEGHRGLTVDILATVNEVLEGTGFELRSKPQR